MSVNELKSVVIIQCQRGKVFILTPEYRLLTASFQCTISAVNLYSLPLFQPSGGSPALRLSCFR